MLFFCPNIVLVHRAARVWNLPVDVQIIQRAGVGVADMLVDPAFVQLTEVGFREDGAAFGLVHSGAEQVSTS